MDDLIWHFEILSLREAAPEAGRCFNDTEILQNLKNLVPEEDCPNEFRLMAGSSTNESGKLHNDTLQVIN